MEIIKHNGREYGYVFKYRNDDRLRKRLNELTQKVYGFDFEDWYQQGYWGENYMPYSLLDGDAMVSNVSVTLINFSVKGRNKTFIQIGTVMTDESARNQGLNRWLLDKVLQEWRGKCDLIYLFANDSVLDFYPKFGFRRVDEYQYSKDIAMHQTGLHSVKLDMSREENKTLLQKKIKGSLPFAQISMIDNASLVMFYYTAFMEDNVHYIEDLDTIAIADLDDGILFLKGVFSDKKVALEDVITALANSSIHKVILEFTPNDTASYNDKILVPDDVLFILDDKSGVFEKDKLMFPTLSHA